MLRSFALVAGAWALAGCGIGVDGEDDFGEAGATGSADTGGSTGVGDGPGASGVDDDDDDTGEQTSGVGFDLGVPDAGTVDMCAVEELDGPPPECSETAPPETFDTPTLEWSFGDGLDHNGKSWATPLVANLTDDNDDGSIDLCDTPDVVLVAETAFDECTMFILDGATGEEHVGVPGVFCDTTPALGDIDNDGNIEIVTMVGGPYMTQLAAFDHDGTELWRDETIYTSFFGGWSGTGLALADLDADGSTEILLELSVHDADGKQLWQLEELGENPTIVVGAPFGADLDGDGDQEFINGGGIYDLEPDAGGVWGLDPDGITYVLPNPTGDALLPPPRLAQVADLLPAHPGPEVLFSAGPGYFLWTADGTFPWGEDWTTPAGIECDHELQTHWGRPANIHDFDGDAQAEVAISACNTFMIFDVTETGPLVLWTAVVDDDSGSSASTSFDFLNDGTPEPIYSDEETAWVWTEAGPGEWQERMALERRSGTIIEYPVVADVDNDGSAEILVVSYDQDVPALQVFGTENNDWVQARRIWNQHAYSVTNIREDGRIPAVPLKSWETLNTFRSGSAINEDGICVPAG